MTETLVAAGDQVPIGSLLDHLRTPAVIAVIVIGVAVGAWSWHKRKNFRSALINGMGTALLLGWSHGTDLLDAQHRRLYQGRRRTGGDEVDRPG